MNTKTLKSWFQLPRGQLNMSEIGFLGLFSLSPKIGIPAVGESMLAMALLLSKPKSFR